MMDVGVNLEFFVILGLVPRTQFTAHSDGGNGVTAALRSQILSDPVCGTLGPGHKAQDDSGGRGRLWPSSGHSPPLGFHVVDVHMIAAFGVGFHHPDVLAVLDDRVALLEIR